MKNKMHTLPPNNLALIQNGRSPCTHFNSAQTNDNQIFITSVFGPVMIKRPAKYEP